MLGLLDIYFKKDLNLERSTKFRREIFEYDKSCTWLVFLPWKTSIEKAQKYKLIPQTGTVIIYEGPYNLVSYIPDEMPEAQQILADDIKEYKQNHVKDFVGIIKILGISQGIYPAFYIANALVKADKFIAVTPATRGEDALWESKAVKKVCEKSESLGYSYKDYKKVLEKGNSVNNIENLPDDIEIYYGGYDRYIRSFLTEELIDELKKIGKSPKVFKYKYLGHFSTILAFGKKLSKGKV